MALANIGRRLKELSGQADRQRCRGKSWRTELCCGVLSGFKIATWYQLG
jgi:hypothetical protein